MNKSGQFANSNVIDLKERRSQIRNPASKNNKQNNKGKFDSAVLDMTERRNQIIGDERRKVRRTILTEFIGAFIIVPNRGLQRVSLYDISDDGLAFDMDLGDGSLKIGEQVAMRVYLNNHTYFPFTATVSNARMIPEDGVHRHGTKFLKGSINDEALHHLVRFIETVSASLETDHGDVMVSNLGR
jgi:hypothetical protein